MKRVSYNMDSYRGESMIKEMKHLISELNVASDMYHNTSNTIMSDKSWDIKFDRLKELEKKTGIVLSNSPSVNVGYEVKSKLGKVKHEYSLRSLGKTQDKNELNKFINNKKSIGMLKLDGLTTDIIYENGELIEGSTRGNGLVGENITHNVKTYTNIPKTIKHKGRVHVVGESIITYDVFDEINKNKEYKNPRNLVSGSVRQLDSRICAKRKVKFLAYNVFGKEFISKEGELKWLEEQGFDVVNYKVVNNLSEDIENLKSISMKKQIPIDGLVFTYDDKIYGESLGNTSHHPNHSMAFKFYDEEEETTLKEVQWQVGRTGVITPVAIFDPVELDGTEVTKATLHNVSTMKKFKLGLGDKITVYKANQIIPQIRENLTQSDTLEIPSKCPVCGHETNIKISDNAEFLMCENPNCKAQLVQKIKHYCSRNAMNIEGLSEKTIEKFIEKGYLNSIGDIYKLKNKKEIKKYDDQVQKAMDQEKTVNQVSKKINELEEKKQKLFKKVNDKDQSTRKKAAEDIVENVKQRQKEFEKEEKALDNSEKEFKQAKQYLEHVENKAKKKEVEQLDSAIKEKYKSHDAYAKAYKKALNKEKELFSYLNEDNATQSEVDGKSKDLSKAYKEMNNKFNAYSKAIEKVKREKQDVDQLK